MRKGKIAYTKGQLIFEWNFGVFNLKKQKAKKKFEEFLP